MDDHFCGVYIHTECHYPNSQFNGDDYEILIIIVHFVLNRSIIIIMDNKNLSILQIIKFNIIGVLGLTLNYIQCIAITFRSTLTQSGTTCKGPIYELKIISIG